MRCQILTAQSNANKSVWAEIKRIVVWHFIWVTKLPELFEGSKTMDPWVLHKSCHLHQLPTTLKKHHRQMKCITMII